MTLQAAITPQTAAPVVTMEIEGELLRLEGLAVALRELRQSDCIAGCLSPHPDDLHGLLTLIDVSLGQIDRLARAIRGDGEPGDEYAENEMRKDFTVTERVAIADAVAREIGDRRGAPRGNTNAGKNKSAKVCGIEQEAWQ